ncbi:MAG TPA: DUF2723 domain-containing protein, partial [Vicinamibacterales bacterium]|nr:DUF2723 domain-containing protein [Vicinamibacterales bacterium]
MTRRSFVPALAVALASLTLYLSTLAPGLVSLEDTPKFQFIGRVLGTAHNPSYPLYVLVSYLFGWLPVGNLAWRINLMSAVCGAATVALMQLCVLQITGSQWLGIGAALGLASGLSFWATSTFAEVYTLHACLIAGMTWCLLRWRRTRTASWFFLAILCFSLGLGHHTSIVVVGPAVAVFAMVVAPRFALAPRTLLATLVLFVAGFAQYLFVILRTRQGAYLESQATNLLELWDVIRGKAWADLVRPLSMETLSTTGPWVLRLIAQEVSLPMALAALGGAAVLLVRDRALLWLCGGAAVGIIMFSVMFPGQTAYFLLPAYFFVWTLAAVAADAVARWRWHDSVRARTAALPLCAVAVWHGWQNYGTNDLTHVRFVMRYFDAVTQQLPAASGIVGEDWLTDRLVLYEKFSDPSFDQRGLEAYADPASWRTAKSGGRPLFAFRGMTSELRWRGFDFEPRMWPLTYGPIREFLDDQRRGSVVAFAIPATHLTTALAHDAVPIDLMGEPIPAPSWSNLVVVGVLGHHGGLRFEQPAEQPTSVIANRGIPIGTTGVASPNHILVEASFDQASIQVNNRQVVSSSWPVVAVWNPHGIFQGAWAITPEG